jgi:hypothetical protein
VIPAAAVNTRMPLIAPVVVATAMRTLRSRGTSVSTAEAVNVLVTGGILCEIGDIPVQHRFTGRHRTP